MQIRQRIDFTLEADMLGAAFTGNGFLTEGEEVCGGIFIGDL